MMFIWLIIGLFIYYLYKNKSEVNINTRKTDSAAEILKQRYVKGEIDDETFERMMKNLKE